MPVKKAYVVFLLLVTYLPSLLSQHLQKMSNADIIFSHNFENNTTGNYKLNEWSRDWLHPAWANRQSSLEITADLTDSINPTKTLKITFPLNSLGPDEGGMNWITHLTHGYDELYLSYDIQFMPDFYFGKGGKLPSLLGGNLSGNLTRPNGWDGFTGGMMFKGNRPAFYIYYADAVPEKYGVTFEWGKKYLMSAFAPSSVMINYAAGPVCFKPGDWHNITYRMVLNSVNDGTALFDGILEAWFDGILVFQISQILFRKTDELKIDCIRMAAFFGGAEDNWRNIKPEWIKLDNIKIYTTGNLTDLPRGNILSATDRIIHYR